MQDILNDLYQKYRSIDSGHLASYIPELTKANPNDFAIAVTTVDGKSYSVGKVDHEFTLQSTSKPFVYGLALEEHGRDFVLSKVGVEPTGDSFNSIIELEKQSHRPYNPMINSGAIATSSLIKGQDPSARLRKILELFQKYTGRSHHIDTSVFLSEKNTAHRNRAIAHLLRHFEVIDSDIDGALDLYFQQCSLLVNTRDLAMMAATLANHGVQPITKQAVLSPDYTVDVISLMFTCGMYDSSGEWAFTVGLPAKSGVSGGLLAVVPGKLGIAVYSPLIEERGHSVRGVLTIKDLSKTLNLNIFDSRKHL